MFTLGKFTGEKQPGWRIVIPIIQKLQKVDIRVKAVDVPDQEVITRDNIPVNINAVVYYKVVDVEKAILEVENFYYAVSQLAQTSMRNSVGEKTLDELLQKRAEIAEQIKVELDEKTDPYGDRIAADNLAAAATKLNEVPGAMHLRTLQAVNDLSSDQSNTTIWMLPIEVLETIKGVGKMMNK